MVRKFHLDRNLLRIPAIIMLIVAFSACSGGADDTDSALPTQSLIEFTPSPSPPPVTPTPTLTPPPAAADLLATAQAADADADDDWRTIAAVQQAITEIEAGVGVSGQPAVQVVDVQPVEWPGTRLDCEAEANPRSQPRFDGYIVVLLLRNTVYTYHTDEEMALRCAETPFDEVSPDVRVLIDLVAADMVALVRESLATRLDLPQRRVDLVALESITWPDNSLGCPAEGITYTPDPLPGYRIVLSAGDETYTYHTDFIQAISCDR